jgi:hypothetical protein
MLLEKQLRDQMELQLGNSWKEKFGTFEMAPFAAASIGQGKSFDIHDIVYCTYEVFDFCLTN